MMTPKRGTAMTRRSAENEFWQTLRKVLRSDAPEHNRKTVREFSEATDIPEETVWRKLRGHLIPEKELQ
jgi:hypothetical protein